MHQTTSNKSPIFIVGMPRSGTTLISAMISAHSSIAISPESHFISYWMKKYSKLDLNLFWEKFSGSKRFSYFGIDAKKTIARILSEDNYTYSTIFTSILQEYANKLGKSRWGEKTPDHRLYIDLLLQWYPQARIIYMIRDPRAVCASLLSVPWGSPSPSVFRHAFRWQKSIKDLKPWLSDPRVKVINYEALVSEPEDVMRQVCEFLDEQFQPAMLNPSEATSPIINCSGWTETHLKTALKPVTTANIEKWQTTLSFSQIATVEYIARYEMIEQGYQPGNEALNFVQIFRLKLVIFALKIKRFLNKFPSFNFIAYRPWVEEK